MTTRLPTDNFRLTTFATMKSFDVPIIYRSPLISAIKKKRKEQDKMKKDFTPAMLNFGPLHI